MRLIDSELSAPAGPVLVRPDYRFPVVASLPDPFPLTGRAPRYLSPLPGVAQQ
jgi:hypothetical protein